MTRRSRIVGFGSAGVLVVAGIACAFAFSGGLAQNLAFVLVALGMVLATSLVFYEVGLTEDRERAREERNREERERQEAAKREHPPERSGRVRLDRMRGRPRRLR
jgi:N-methylhydantoinase A/oxoprolinase/acetone carboxylase beta subunit